MLCAASGRDAVSVATVDAAAPSTVLKVSQVGTDSGSETNCGFVI